MVDRIMVGRIHGTVGVEGNHLLLMWFRGLIRKVVPIGSAGSPGRLCRARTWHTTPVP